MLETTPICQEGLHQHKPRTLEKPSRRVTAPWRTFDSNCANFFGVSGVVEIYTKEWLKWKIYQLTCKYINRLNFLPRELKFTLALFPTMHFSWLWNLLALRYKSKWLWSAAGPSGTSNLSFIHAFGSVQFSSFQFSSCIYPPSPITQHIQTAILPTIAVHATLQVSPLPSPSSAFASRRPQTAPPRSAPLLGAPAGHQSPRWKVGLYRGDLDGLGGLGVRLQELWLDMVGG